MSTGRAYYSSKPTKPAKTAPQSSSSSSELNTYLKKTFPPDPNKYVGKIIRIRPKALHNKTLRVLYEDGDVEDLSHKSVSTLRLKWGAVSDGEIRRWERAKEGMEVKGVSDEEGDCDGDGDGEDDYVSKNSITSNTANNNNNNNNNDDDSESSDEQFQQDPNQNRNRNRNQSRNPPRTILHSNPPQIIPPIPNHQIPPILSTLSASHTYRDLRTLDTVPLSSRTGTLVIFDDVSGKRGVRVGIVEFERGQSPYVATIRFQGKGNQGKGNCEGNGNYGSNYYTNEETIATTATAATATTTTSHKKTKKSKLLNSRPNKYKHKVVNPPNLPQQQQPTSTSASNNEPSSLEVGKFKVRDLKVLERSFIIESYVFDGYNGVDVCDWNGIVKWVKPKVKVKDKPSYVQQGLPVLPNADDSDIHVDPRTNPQAPSISPQSIQSTLTNLPLLKKETFTWTCKLCTFLNSHFRRFKCQICEQNFPKKHEKTGEREGVSENLKVALEFLERFRVTMSKADDSTTSSTSSSSSSTTSSSSSTEIEIEMNPIQQKSNASEKFKESIQSYYKSHPPTTTSPTSPDPSQQFIVPYSLIFELLGCVGLTSRSNKPCIRQCLEGYEYCTFHKPFNPNETTTSMTTKRKGFYHSSTVVELCMIESKSYNNSINNPLSHKRLLHSIEDTLISLTPLPSLLPLGFVVRRFFLGYGFFDGKVIFIHRALSNAVQTHPSDPPPLLTLDMDCEFVYRIRYEDGDEEDLTYKQITSLRQLYDCRAIPESSGQDVQIRSGLKFTVHNGARGQVIAHLSDIACVVVKWYGGADVHDLVDRRMCKELYVGGRGKVHVVRVDDLEMNLREVIGVGKDWEDEADFRTEDSISHSISTSTSSSPPAALHPSPTLDSKISTMLRNPGFRAIVLKYVILFNDAKSKGGGQSSSSSSSSSANPSQPNQPSDATDVAIAHIGACSPSVKSVVSRLIDDVKSKGGVFKTHDPVTMYQILMPEKQVMNNILSCLVHLSKEVAERNLVEEEKAVAILGGMASSSSSSSSAAAASKKRPRPDSTPKSNRGRPKKVAPPSTRPVLEWPRNETIISSSSHSGSGITSLESAIGSPNKRFFQRTSKKGGVVVGSDSKYLIDNNVWLSSWVTNRDQSDDDFSSSDDEHSDDEERREVEEKKRGEKSKSKSYDESRGSSNGNDNEDDGNPLSPPPASRPEGPLNGPLSWFQLQREERLSNIANAQATTMTTKAKANSKANGNSTSKIVPRPAMVWDPCAVLPYLKWDPLGTVVCEVCKDGADEDRILLCDKCHNGFHMYCLRPVVNKVPVGEWLCPGCKPRQVSITREAFAARVEVMINDSAEQRAVSNFLGLPFVRPESFFEVHKELHRFLNYDTKDAKNAFNREGDMWKLGKIYQSFNPPATLWRVPAPLKDKKLYIKSCTEIAAAMLASGMKSCSNDLVYTDKATRSMNKSALDAVGNLSVKNLDIFNVFKENTKNGVLPPLALVYDSLEGFTVEALADIAKTTLLIEYCGVVTRISDSGFSDSDSLMILLETDSSKTSLIIDPTTTGNLARFLSGVNNSSVESRRKINVKTRRFALDGECRIALYSSRKILKGEKLHYDYNAGIASRGVDEGEWASHGYYDTSNFC